MSKICLHVEYLPGTDFYGAILEASQKAMDLNVAYIVFNFNGTSVSVQPGCSIKSMDQAWQEFLDGSKYIIVKGEEPHG